MNKTISQIDKKHYQLIRKNIKLFLRHCGYKYDRKDSLVLDIAPQAHEGAGVFFPKSRVFTLDINKDSKADIIADICKNNQDKIPAKNFDIIVCTEVLEHTLDPFKAIEELYRLLKPLGYILISTPFNFRIHGPLPDCWRFTEHGLRALLKNFKILKLKKLATEKRYLMPVHYTVVAQRQRDFL